jgi:hypothetical protein
MLYFTPYVLIFTIGIYRKPTEDRRTASSDSDSDAADPSNNPHPVPPDLALSRDHDVSYRLLYDIRDWLASWKKEWGPVSTWQSCIIDEYNVARDKDKVKEWRLKMSEKREDGLEVIGWLRGMFQMLPTSAWKVRDLWSQAFALLEEIQAGVSCISAMVDVYSGP